MIRRPHADHVTVADTQLRSLSPAVIVLLGSTTMTETHRLRVNHAQLEVIARRAECSCLVRRVLPVSPAQRVQLRASIVQQASRMTTIVRRQLVYSVALEISWQRVQLVHASNVLLDSTTTTVTLLRHVSHALSANSLP